MIDWLGLLDKHAISILTAILVIITGYYAWQTKLMVAEMVIARRHQFMPSLKIKPTRIYIGDSFDVEIINIGLGPAKNIKGTIALKPGCEEVEVVCPILYPQKRLVLHAPFAKAKVYADVKNLETLELTASFQDLADSNYEKKDVFTLSDLEKVKNDDYPRDRTVDELREISKKLSDIKTAIITKK